MFVNQEDPLTINPRMISLAREAQGWNQRQLADQVQMTQGFLSKIENGNAEPGEDLVERLANVLACPPALFSFAGPSASIEVTCLHHRRRASTMSAPTKKRIEALARLTRISVESLMDGIHVTHGETLERPSESGGDPPASAADLRARLGIPAGPIDDLTYFVERAGVIVVRRPLSTAAQDAVSTWSADRAPMMLVNSGLAPDRERFTIAHELGHLVMHNAPGDEQEEEANEFASALLAPADSIREDLVGLGGRDFARLMKLKTKWGMSIAALVRRAFDLDLIDADRYRSYQIQLSKLGWRQSEPGQVRADQTRLLQRIIDARRSHDDLGTQQLAELALMTETEFRRVFLPHESEHPTVEVTLDA
jgi:Zn-dependent peptidase ImmA (M78 family)/DNA-binding XRE family transcriptional regulator